MTAQVAVDLVVLVLVGWPVARLSLRREFRQITPVPWIVLTGSLIAAAVVVVFLALERPIVLHWLVGAVVVCWLVGLWFSRASYGRRRGLPPGSLSLIGSLEAMFDFWFYRREFQRHGPVFKMLQFHQPTICVLGLERSHDLMQRHDASLGPAALPFSADVEGTFLRYMDDATHDVYGKLFRDALAASVVNTSREHIAGLVTEELKSLAEASASASGHGVHPDESLHRIVLDAFLEAMLGFSAGSEASKRFKRHYAAFEKHSVSKPLVGEARESFDALQALLAAEGERLRSLAPREGPPTSTLEALVRADPEMPDRTCIDNILFIIRISTFNVLGLLAWLFHVLGRHPEWVERLRVDLEGRPPTRPSGLSGRIVMETLRLHQSEYLYRRIDSEFETEGFTFPQGWLLRMCVRESHRSPDQYVNPDAFDPDRFLARDVTSSAYAPFGHGRHACNGVGLTQVICQAVMEELTRSYDWYVVRDGHYERDFRHWSHYRPSSDLAVTLMPLAGD